MIHIAGLPLRLRGRTLQRCAWCAQALVDCMDANTISSDGTPAGVWPTGAFVFLDGGAAWVIRSHSIDDAGLLLGSRTLPGGTCLDPGSIPLRIAKAAP